MNEFKEILKMYINNEFKNYKDIIYFNESINKLHKEYLLNEDKSKFYKFNVFHYITSFNISFTEGIINTNKTILSHFNNNDKNFLEKLKCFIKYYDIFLHFIKGYLSIYYLEFEIKMQSFIDENAYLFLKYYNFDKINNVSYFQKIMKMDFGDNTSEIKYQYTNETISNMKKDPELIFIGNYSLKKDIDIFLISILNENISLLSNFFIGKSKIFKSLNLYYNLKKTVKNDLLKSMVFKQILSKINAEVVLNTYKNNETIELFVWKLIKEQQPDIFPNINKLDETFFDRNKKLNKIYISGINNLIGEI